jgi:hypothetical protein
VLVRALAVPRKQVLALVQVVPVAVAMAVAPERVQVEKVAAPEQALVAPAA